MRTFVRWFLGGAALCAAGPAVALSQETVIYNFQKGLDGAGPVGGLIADTAGALYGTTTYGNSNHGAVFKLTPPASGKTIWTETTLHTFDGSSGGAPHGRLLFGANGVIYGTTDSGGRKGAGVVFKLTPPAKGKTAWTYAVLYQFTGKSDGGAPRAGLISDDSGALYGTTSAGGIIVNGSSGNGTVFKLTPPASTPGVWTETVLYRFTGGKDGGFPRGAVTPDVSVLYGTTASGGNANGNGVVFKLTPATGGKTWKQTVLYTFTGGKDGGAPDPGVIRDAANGTLYGTTYFGGGTTNGSGVVYSLTPPKSATGTWKETTLYAFRGLADGGHPYEGQLILKGGFLYGTTQGSQESGLGNGGTVFELIPPKAGSTTWTEHVLYDFKNGLDGGGPDSGVLVGKSGEFYGTANTGGTKVNGVVYKLVP